MPLRATESMTRVPEPWLVTVTVMLLPISRSPGTLMDAGLTDIAAHKLLAPLPLSETSQDGSEASLEAIVSVALSADVVDGLNKMVTVQEAPESKEEQLCSTVKSASSAPEMEIELIVSALELLTLLTLRLVETVLRVLTVPKLIDVLLKFIMPSDWLTVNVCPAALIVPVR